MLEKAWAKLLGTYARVVEGEAGFLRAHLTGIPYKSIDHMQISSYKEIWNKFALVARRTNLMISVIANGFYLNEYKQLNLSGLKEAECFEVLDV